MLFRFCAGTSRVFESHSVLFIFYIVAEIGEGGGGGCVIVFMASFVGGGRGMDLWRRKLFGCHFALVHSACPESRVELGWGGKGSRHGRQEVGGRVSRRA